MNLNLYIVRFVVNNIVTEMFVEFSTLESKHYLDYLNNKYRELSKEVKVYFSKVKTYTVPIEPIKLCDKNEDLLFNLNISTNITYLNQQQIDIIMEKVTFTDIDLH